MTKQVMMTHNYIDTKSQENYDVTVNFRRSMILLSMIIITL